MIPCQDCQKPFKKKANKRRCKGCSLKKRKKVKSKYSKRNYSSPHKDAESIRMAYL